MNVAQEIANQLGRKALFMLGAKFLTSDGNALRFGISGSKKFNYIKIELNRNDNYDITFLKATYSKGIKNETKIADVGVENLHFIITQETGLHTNI
jgi:hypothetical protein